MTIKVLKTLQLIVVIAAVFYLNFLYDLVHLGEFTLAPDLRVVLNSDTY